MSLNGSMCFKTTQGYLLTTPLDSNAPDGFNGGTPLVADGRIAVTSVTTGLSRVAGLAYDSVGRLSVVSAGPVVAWVAGVPVDSAGRVFFESAAPVAYAPNGIPITAAGAVAMVSGSAPADLFRNGEEGVWFDPSDLDTLYQDAAGTTPVTGTGQTVRKVMDKSGRGHHAITTGDPTLELDDQGLYYLDFQADDGMDTGSINFTTTDKMTVWTGLQKVISTLLSH